MNTPNGTFSPVFNLITKKSRWNLLSFLKSTFRIQIRSIHHSVWDVMAFRDYPFSAWFLFSAVIDVLIIYCIMFKMCHENVNVYISTTNWSNNITRLCSLHTIW